MTASLAKALNALSVKPMKTIKAWAVRNRDEPRNYEFNDTIYQVAGFQYEIFSDYKEALSHSFNDRSGLIRVEIREIKPKRKVKT